MLDKTLTVILAGGNGSRLKPLTLERAKPAVPFGGQYRIIDFTLANCLHSGLRRVLVLTQYKSHSLQKHLRDGWSLFNPELSEYITAVPPQMRGDHIYRMDYAPLLAFHEEHSSGVTLASMEVPVSEASQFGVMGADEQGRVTSFEEKSENPQPCTPGDENALVSMGIYVFSLDQLITILEEDHQRAGSGHDFDFDILPKLVVEDAVYTYRFGGKAGRVSRDRYWRDVGTLDSYYESNMQLLDPQPALDLYQPEWPIRTHHLQYPPARTVPGVSGSEGIFINSIVANGVLIVGGSVQRSILFPNVRIGDEAVIHNSILFEGVEVGDGAELDNCIIDKGVVIPPRERIGFDKVADAERFSVSDKGIVVVPKGYQF
ncbi:MAG: sugar phosphate nucleotidyltransferase [Candidatus Thiodiazotropha sp.]